MLKIYGLQKMTLLDYPGHVACTVFLNACNFRCPYCHNYELVTGDAPPVMETAELYAFLDKRHGLLDGVAITGGEPCLHPELPELICGIRERGFGVKLDTNGCYPDMLERLLSEGLVDYAAMDIKNSPERYAQTVGLDPIDLEPVRRSIGLLMDSSIEYEFRTTVVDELHEEADFDGIGQMIRGAKRYFLQAFTDRDTVPFAGLHAPSQEKMKNCLARVKPWVKAAQIRGMDMDK